MREIETNIESMLRRKLSGTTSRILSHTRSPHTPRAGGDLREGAVVEVTVERVGAKSHTIKMSVSALEPAQKLQ